MLPLRSSSPARSVSPRGDPSMTGEAFDDGSAQGRANEGTVRLLHDLAAFGALTAVPREPVQARLEAIGPWLASLAYALVHEPRLAYPCHEA
jgi:hypothetical protein